MNRETINENNVSFESLKNISTIMSLLLIISIACSLLVHLKAIEHRSPRLQIYSPNLPHHERGLSNFTFNQHGNLVLTCEVISNEHFPIFNVSLQSPRMVQSNNSTSVTLHIVNVSDTDSGTYVCKAQGRGSPLYENVTVRVVKELWCSSSFFSCLGTSCIFPRFLCDGKKDCPNGADESPIHANCSLNPCENKIMCGDRCVPQHWCCSDCNITHIQPCCNNPTFGDISELRRRDDGFLETTIYVVIGCGTAFMFLLIIVVIAVCRFHMKRTPVPRHPGNMACRTGGRGTRLTVPPGMGDFDVYLNQALLDLSQHSGLLVTYNINNGVQIMGRPVDPPPYCEVVSLPPRGGPPPPYVANENMPRFSTDDCEETAVSEDDALLGGAPRITSAPSHSLPDAVRAHEDCVPVPSGSQQSSVPGPGSTHNQSGDDLGVCVIQRTQDIKNGLVTSTIGASPSELGIGVAVSSGSFTKLTNHKDTTG